ncbi:MULTISPECIES: hypothetical protein [unclassified Microbacterium]|uniref:hypothetical protein n=1 Tax=unclassified Microbacterium TaxID=2609290 RepID=UPI003744F3D2
MSYGIDLDCGGLRDHAGRIDNIARSLDDPIGAVQYVTLGADAYGIMCGFAGLPTTLMGAGAGAALLATRGVLERAAELVRLAADEFEQQEQEYCTQLKELENTIDGTVYV